MVCPIHRQDLVVELSYNRITNRALLLMLNEPNKSSWLMKVDFRFDFQNSLTSEQISNIILNFIMHSDEFTRGWCSQHSRSGMLGEKS